ncbi:isochorismatase family cysteine hydrolase [Antarcticirhabdus aurantiaca]|uniref:Cysteine hydrolase n=1 Tax=Antarcticirhabdus aurantiaca TaxID=2606717 RepID=A0ACD4NN94_9HYPH|nr:isochorismatase family cysteine hydrolase [Antarcticirhabdus aurantiaca]WAJ28178.1 cysteine hydrolase [Jeongeuplla avenae]
MTQQWSREVSLDPRQSALLFVDVQNYAVHRDGAEFKEGGGAQAERFAYYLERLERVALPNMTRLQAGFRAAGIEVLYTVIENLTADGRDRSLDYKISGIDVPKGSWDGQVHASIQPGADEIVIRKTSSSVFISTNIDYVLRNLGIRQLVICGVVSDQCVESAVRDACDLGYLVTLVPDACATYSADRQAASVRAIAGYCRQRDTDALLAELAALPR